MTSHDLRIIESTRLIDPQTLWNESPLTPMIHTHITKARDQVKNILRGNDDRILIIVGPCSIHDPHAALEYAQKIAEYSAKFRNELCLFMRVYFEKPRTTLGWKGLINDPYLDSSFKINDGLRLTRQLLLDINQLGVPTSSEFLDTMIPQYIADLTSWAAIGARTAESQIHRELASGLAMPVGFKNSTTGDIQIAIDAVYAASHPHRFLGITAEGHVASIVTRGNSDCHIILRGSQQQPNYDSASIAAAVQSLQAQQLSPHLMIDCSHGNSGRDHLKQLQVVSSLARQIAAGNHHICGIMIESNLMAGKQTLEMGKPLVYGQSITDACISWEDTLQALTQLQHAVQQRRNCGVRSRLATSLF